MKSGYESLVWIRDQQGKEYACYADDLKKTARTHEDLSSEQKSRCLDVNELVGTERW